MVLPVDAPRCIAQPLYVDNLRGSRYEAPRNVVFVAAIRNSIFAFDAKCRRVSMISFMTANQPGAPVASTMLYAGPSC